MKNNNEILLNLNLLAQGIKKIEDGKEWFVALSPIFQTEVLRDLSNLIIQAGARKEDIVNAIKKIKLKRTFTPCVLLSQGNLKVQLSKLLGLPNSENMKSFLLLIEILSIADKRRRDTTCKDGCLHWWHQDLSEMQEGEK